jgi:hypothetical protein
VRLVPQLEHVVLDLPHRLLFRDAGVGDAVQMALEQLLVVLGPQLPEVRHADVVVVRDQIVDVLLQVRAGDGDGVHLPAPDELGDHDAQLGGAHGPAHGEHHLAAGGEVDLPRLRRVDQGRGVEVPEVVDDEVTHGSHGTVPLARTDAVNQGGAATLSRASSGAACARGSSG